jgi:hypothetical protein
MASLVAVSAPLVMSLHDSDIPMNVPITFRTKQTITTAYGWQRKEKEAREDGVGVVKESF